MTLHHHHHPPPPPPPTTINSMSAISQLLLTLFWPNFKVRSLGPSLTDSNYHGDICPGNICHGDISPYMRNISAITYPILTKLFEHDFAGLIFMDQNFQWTNLLFDQNFFGSKTFWTQNVVDSPFGDSKFCWTLIFLALTFFGPTFFGPTFCSNFILNSNINATTKQNNFNGFWHN